ncbi:MAG: O-antigen ligase family protein [bacterium]
MFLTKITNYLVLLFLFLLPWQTRYIYQYGEINGQHWEYGTFSLFATEILLWLIVILFGIGRFGERKFWNKITSKQHFKTHWKNLLFIFIFLGLNTLFVFASLDSWISYQQVLWILAGLCIGLVIINSEACMKLKMPLALWLGGVLQAFLATVQFFNQKILACKWLGMSAQDPADLGVSVIEFADQRWLRAYGSFGWPNSLGVFLATCLLVGLIILIKHRKLKKYYLWMTAGQIVILSGLILSFSRGAWLAVTAGIIVLVYIIRKNKILFEQLFYYLSLSLVSVVLLAPLFVARFNLENRVEYTSINEHKYQYIESANVIYRNFILGTGPGTYTLNQYQDNPNLQAWQYQPTHNVYMLWLAEMGILGLVLYCLLILFLFKIIWKHNRVYAPIVVVVLVHGFFDHWLWSLYGGVVFWWVAWTLAMNRTNEVNSGSGS